MHSKRAASLKVLLPVILLLVTISVPAHGQNVAFTSTQTTAAPRGFSSLPAAVQGPISAALGRSDSRYWFQANAGSLHAENPQHSLALDFTAQRVEVRTKATR
jgi:hypothetical protein